MVKYYCDICEFEVKGKSLIEYHVPTLQPGRRGMADDEWHLCPVCADAYQDAFRKFVIKRRVEVGK